MSRINEGYVYIIGNPIFGWYKIGKSKTPELRVKVLGVLLPFKLDVIGIWKANNYHLLEKTLHEIYTSSKINGEWFEFDRKEIVKVFESLPLENRIFPIDNQNAFFDKFSNVEEDLRKSNRVLRVKVEKLRGNFTTEERNNKRLAAIEAQKIKKALKCKEALN